MAIKNIRLLQSDVTSDINVTEKNTIIQALANLGQRDTINMNGIKYKSFSFTDCFEKSLTLDPSSQIGFIKYFGETNKKCLFGILNKENNIPAEIYPNENNNISNISESFIIDNNVDHIHKLENKLEFDVQINNILSYNKNSFIQYKDGYYYTLMFGNIFGADDEEYNVEIIYNKFKASTNELSYALRLYHFKDSNNEPIYCLLEIDNDVLRVYKFDTNEVENSFYNKQVITEIANFFKESYYEQDNYTDQILRLFNNINISNKSDIISVDTIFGVIMDSENGKRKYQIGHDIELHRNTTNNILYYVDDIDYSIFLNYGFDVDKYGITIKDRITYINNDITYVFPRFIQEYNKYYSTNIEYLYQHIFMSIFDKFIYNEYGIDRLSSDNFDNLSTLFIPLDLNIYYYVNSENEFNIYNVSNIFINILDAETYISTLNFDNKVFNNICFCSGAVNTNKCLNIIENISYNKIHNNLIDYIDVQVKYILPYIDPYTYNWIINDSNSGISSTLNRFNNQYIFLVFSGAYNKTNNTIDGEILNALPDQLNVNSFIPAQIKFAPYTYFGNQLNIIEGEKKILRGYTAIPKIDKSMDFLYKNSIVISIMPSTNIVTEDDIIYENDIWFSTLWTYDDTLTTENKFRLITDKNGDPIDMSYLLNLNVAAQRVANSSNYIYEYVGMLMSNRLYHNYVNNSNDDHVFVTYPENFANGYPSDKEGNNISIGKKVINNKLDISKNELLLIDNEQIKNISNSIKFLSFELGNENGQSYLTQTSLDPTNSEILKYDDISLKQQTVSTTGTINEDLVTNVVTPGDGTGEVIATTSNMDVSTNITYTNLVDYKFNIDMPIVNNSEIITSHNNILNRLNILTLDKDPSKTTNNDIIYNTIIGSEQDINKKSTFVIKSTNNNIDMGSQTLITNKDRTLFRKQDKLLIEFDNIEINTKSFDLNTIFERTYNVGDYIFNKHSISMIGQINVNDIILNIENIIETKTSSIFSIGHPIVDESLNYEMSVMINNERYYGFNLYKYFHNLNIDVTTEYSTLYHYIEENKIDFKFNDNINDKDCVKIAYVENMNDGIIYILIKQSYVDSIAEIDSVSSLHIYDSKCNIELIKMIRNTDDEPLKYILKIS